MTRARFTELVRQALDTLPSRFRERIRNVAVLVEDYPPGERPRKGRPRALRAARPRTMGVFVGQPLTQKSVFDLAAGPSHIVLYRKNIEAVCRTDRQIREQVRLTVIHEFGHYFGLEEDDLWDV